MARRRAAAQKCGTPGRIARDREQLNTRLAQQNELLKQREEELSRQNAGFDMALNNMSQGLCMFDSDHRLVVCNARYLQMYGLTPEQTQPGTGILQLLHYRVEQGSFPHGPTPRRIRSGAVRVAAARRLPGARSHASTTAASLPSLTASCRVADGSPPMTTSPSAKSCMPGSKQHELALQQEEQLRRSNLQFDMAVNNMSQGLCFFDGAQRLKVCNDRYLEMYGLDPEQVRPGVTLSEIIDLRFEVGSFPAMSKEEYHAWRNSIAVSDKPSDTIVELQDGRIFEIHHRPMSGGGWVATHDDITESQRLKAELERNNKLLSERTSLLQAIVDNFPGGIGFFDNDLRVVVCNDKAKVILDLPERLFANGPPRLEDLLRFNAVRGEYGAGDVEELVATKLALTADRTTYHFERERPNGIVLDVRGAPIEGGGFVTTYMDITERHRSAAKIAHMARHDALTNLSNRVLLNERLDQGLKRAEPDERVALHLIDLDRFKTVNDTLGHPAGDRLLQMVAERLRGLVRESDTIARIGGDEFAIAQVTIAEPAEAAILAQRVIDAVSEPYDIDGHQAVIGASIGIAMGPGEGRSPEQLVRNADLALYRAKNDGRGTFCFFEAAMDAQMQARHAMEKDMRKALAAGEFELYYQPMVNLKSGEISGFEALLRWHHPTHGLVMPDKFMPLADETGFIVPIGEWTIREACARAAKWPRHLRVAVNLSPVQFRSAGLAAGGRRRARRIGPGSRPAGARDQRDGALGQRGGRALNPLSAARSRGADRHGRFRHGIFVAELPAELPLRQDQDRPLVRAATSPTATGSLKIVRAVATLAQGFGMETTVEGVESLEQLAAVKAEGCNEMQGYLFSRPLPAGEIERLFLRDLRSARAGSSVAA